MYLANVNKLNPIVKYYHIKTIALYDIELLENSLVS